MVNRFSLATAQSSFLPILAQLGRRRARLKITGNPSLARQMEQFWLPLRKISHQRLVSGFRWIQERRGIQTNLRTHE